MTPEQHAILIEEIKTHTAEVIRTTVNGKIDKIDKKMDNLQNSYEDHAKVDAIWQATADPAIKGINQIVGTGKLLVAFIAGLTVLFGFGMMLYQLFK